MEDFAGFILLAALFLGGAALGHLAGEITETSRVKYHCKHFQKVEIKDNEWLECKRLEVVK